MLDLHKVGKYDYKESGTFTSCTNHLFVDNDNDFTVVIDENYDCVEKFDPGMENGVLSLISHLLEHADEVDLDQEVLEAIHIELKESFNDLNDWEKEKAIRLFELNIADYIQENEEEYRSIQTDMHILIDCDDEMGINCSIYIMDDIVYLMDISGNLQRISSLNLTKSDRGWSILNEALSQRKINNINAIDKPLLKDLIINHYDSKEKMNSVAKEILNSNMLKILAALL